MTILYFIIALGILIFVHEVGHFIMAKRAGVRVDTFSLGFGPRLFGFRKGGTDYRVSLLPFGGYVRMLGEDPDEEHSDDPASFSAKSVWARFKVIVFGPAMNAVFCLAVMPLVFFIGRMEPKYLAEPPLIMGVRAGSPAADAGIEKGDLLKEINKRPVMTWEDVSMMTLLAPGEKLAVSIQRAGTAIKKQLVVGELPELRGGYVGIEPMLFMGNEAVIDGVRAGWPADDAGLRKGDKVAAFAGKPVVDWIDLSTKVNENGAKDAGITIERGGELMSFVVRPVLDKDFDKYLIGISKERQSGVPMISRRYGLVDSLRKGVEETWRLAMLTLSVIYKLVTAKISYKAVMGGPIIIAKVSASAASAGFSNFIYFLAFLSIQLAIFNLLPIPVLDGGQVVFIACEAVRGRPLGKKFRSMATQAGFVFLILLMAVIVFNDIDNVWGVRTLLDKIF